MNEFTHEELQQVIRKYDSEYKRIKKQINGKACHDDCLDNTAKMQDLEERAGKAEKDNVTLKDQALCY
jgi:hypothetical protein